MGVVIFLIWICFTPFIIGFSLGYNKGSKESKK